MIDESEPWAWAVMWEGHTLDGGLDFIVFSDETDAYQYVGGITLEEGDAEPQVVPLHPREGTTE
jgi:hypothetical protein